LANLDASTTRVYSQGFGAAGNQPSQPVEVAFDLYGFNRTQFTMRALAMDNFARGVRATGLDCGTNTPATKPNVQVLTGASSAGMRLYDVRQRADLISTGFYYEEPVVPPVNSLIQLDSASSGRLAISSQQLATTNNPLPIVRTINSSADLTILNINYPLKSPVAGRFNFNGTTNSNVFGALFYLDQQGSQVPSSVTNIWQSNSPAVRNSVFAMNSYTATELSSVTNNYCADANVMPIAECEYSYLNYTDGMVAANPSAAFVTKQIELLRTLDTAQAQKDNFKILRIIVGAAAGRNAVTMIGQAATCAIAPNER
jgi:hypothetical protein